jgi:preprotein translocase subunit SecB
MADSQAGAPKSDAPSISVLTQYIKDMSFENPNAPMSLAPQQQAPSIAVNVNVNARALSETDYEVELVLVGQAGEAPQLLFQMELTYCGIFRLQNIPAEQSAPVVMIECPRLLFPFARQIVADSVRNGGFPPLYIDPIDFAGLFQERQQELANQDLANKVPAGKA